MDRPAGLGGQCSLNTCSQEKEVSQNLPAMLIDPEKKGQTEVVWTVSSCEREKQMFVLSAFDRSIFACCPGVDAFVRIRSDIECILQRESCEHSHLFLILACTVRALENPKSA